MATYEIECKRGAVEGNLTVAMFIDVADATLEAERDEALASATDPFDFMIGAGEWRDARVVRKVDL